MTNPLMWPKKLWDFVYLQAVLWHSDYWTGWNRLKLRYEPDSETVPFTKLTDPKARLQENYETAKTLARPRTDMVAKAEPAAVPVDDRGRAVSRLECPECKDPWDVRDIVP